MWVLCAELVSCHPSDSQNFEVAPRFGECFGPSRYNELQRYTICSVARFAAVDLYLQQVAFKASGIFCVRAASSYLIDIVIFTDDGAAVIIN